MESPGGEKDGYIISSKQKGFGAIATDGAYSVDGVCHANCAKDTYIETIWFEVTAQKCTLLQVVERFLSCIDCANESDYHDGSSRVGGTDCDISLKSRIVQMNLTEWNKWTAQIALKANSSICYSRRPCRQQ